MHLFLPNRIFLVRTNSLFPVSIFHQFQAEGAGAFCEREGQRDPAGHHPRGNPLHRLSQKSAGEEESGRGGGEAK